MEIVLCKRDPTELPGPYCHVRIRREVSNLEEGPGPTMLVPWSQTSNFQNCEREISVVRKLPSL